MAILLAVHKRDLWPIGKRSDKYSEEDFFDVIEFLFQHVSKPIDGQMHSWNECGMHWETFNQKAGRDHYREQVNDVLEHYERQFELIGRR